MNPWKEEGRGRREGRKEGGERESVKVNEV